MTKETLKISARSQTIAYRIWCVAKPLEWDISISELAEALDLNHNSIRSVLQLKGWLNRLRPSERRDNNDMLIGDIKSQTALPGAASWQDPRSYEESNHA
jgi:hypothetical protein